MGKEWVKVKKIGQLYLEKILVHFDVPVLFVCTDFENRRYLCMNIDDETGKTIIALTSKKYLIDMLENKITMDYVFKKTLDNKITIVEYDKKKKEVITSIMNVNDTPKEFFPKKDEYFELYNKTLEEYLSFLKKQLLKVEYESFISNNVGIISESISRNSLKANYLFEYTLETKMISKKKDSCLYSLSRDKEMIA